MPRPGGAGFRVVNRHQHGLAALVLRRRREVAVAPLRQADASRADRPLRLPENVEVVEDERLVLDDRPAGRAAAVVAAQLRLRVVLPAGRVERVVAHEVVEAAVPSVRSAARNRRDDARGTAAVFRAHRVDLDLELLHGVHRRRHFHVLHAQAAARIVDAVDIRAGRARAPAADRHVAVRFRAEGAGNQVHQIEDVAVGQRQLLNLLDLNGRAHRAGGRLHLQLLGGDLDDLGQRSDFQSEVIRNFRSHVQAQPVDGRLLEAVGLDGNVVQAGGQGQRIGAVNAALDRIGDAGLGVGDGHPRARDHRARGVADRAVDDAVGALPEHDRGQQENERRNPEQAARRMIVRIHRFTSSQSRFEWECPFVCRVKIQNF